MVTEDNLLERSDEMDEEAEAAELPIEDCLEALALVADEPTLEAEEDRELMELNEELMELAEELMDESLDDWAKTGAAAARATIRTLYCMMAFSLV